MNGTTNACHPAELGLLAIVGIYALAAAITAVLFWVAFAVWDWWNG